MSEMKICHLKDKSSGEIRVVVLEKCYRNLLDRNGNLIKEYFDVRKNLVYSSDPSTVVNVTTTLMLEEDLREYFVGPINESRVTAFEKGINRGATLAKVLR